jgi:hypothetical protein
MREFTKSMTSYTWAMSLFGLQQMVNVFRPSQATQSFNHVTKATEEQFGDALKATFRAGDNLQRGLVDMTFGVLTLGMFDRGGGAQTTSDVARQTGEALRQGGRAVSQAVGAVNQTVQSATAAAAGAAQQSAGWAATPSMSYDARTQPRRDAQSSPRPSSSGSEGGGQQGWGPMPTQGSGGPTRR